MRLVTAIGVGFLLLLMGGVGPADASTAPESAYARAIGVPPFFLIHDSLVFMMPHIGAEMGTQAFAINITGNGSANVGLGGLGQLGDHRLFLLSRDLTRLTDSSVPKALQVGWAIDFESIRSGVAIRGATRDTESLSTDNVDYLQEVKDETQGLEAAFSLGIGRNRTRWDILIEGLVAERESRQVRQVGGNPPPTFSEELKAEVEGGPTVGSRLVLPLSRGTDLVAVGRWTGYTVSYKGSAVDVDSTLASVDTDVYADDWEAGLAVRGTSSLLGDAWGYLHYRSLRRPDYSFSRGQTRANSRTERVGAIGLGVDRKVWKLVHVLVGLQQTYREQAMTTTFARPGSPLIVNEQSSTNTSNRFSWGADVKHRHFRITGSVDATLTFDDLFLGLDVWLLL